MTKYLSFPFDVLLLLVGPPFALQNRRLYGVGVLFHQCDIVHQPLGARIYVHVNVQMFEHNLYAKGRQTHAVQQEHQRDVHRCRMVVLKAQIVPEPVFVSAPPAVGILAGGLVKAERQPMPCLVWDFTSIGYRSEP